MVVEQALAWEKDYITLSHHSGCIGLGPFFKVTGSFLISLFRFQGLFHPARKVREAYWKIYNTLYIGSQVRIVLGMNFYKHFILLGKVNFCQNQEY